MNNIRDSCGVLVFSDEKQVSDCAKSVQYKRTSAFNSAMIGFFVSWIIFMIIFQYCLRKNKKISSIAVVLYIIGSALFTYLIYNKAYNSADGSDLKALYIEDQKEIKRREVNFPGNIQANINDLISDRQNLRQAYLMGRRHGR